MIRMSWHIKCFLITIDGLNQPIRLPGLKPGVCSGLILHFDKLSVLSLSKEAAFFTPI